MTAIPTSALSTTDRRADTGRLADVPAETMLRWVLRTDSLVSGANGVAYVVAASALDGMLGLSAPFLRGVGVFFVVFAAIVWTVARRTPPAVTPVREVIAANVFWTVASLAFVVSGAADLTTVGTVWLLLQAVAVAGLAGAQGWALRRTTDA